MRIRVLLGTAALALMLWAALPLASSGQSAKSEQLSELQQRIDRARAKIGSKRGTERVLSSDITRYSRRIDRLQGKIGVLSAREGRIEVELASNRTELERLRSSLRRARARLVRLRKRVTETGNALRDRLVEIYKAPKPDIVTVILNSDGFADLIERGEFIKRISDQDRRIVSRARQAKADAIGAERRLDGLERRQQSVTAGVQKRRDEVSAIRLDLVGARVGYARTKAGKASALRRVRGQRTQLESNLDGLEAASRRITSQLQAARAATTRQPLTPGPSSAAADA